MKKWAFFIFLFYLTDAFAGCGTPLELNWQNLNKRIFWAHFMPKIIMSYKYSPASRSPRQYSFNADEPLTISDEVYDNSQLDYIDNGDGQIKPGLQTEFDGRRHAFFVHFVWSLDDIIFSRYEVSPWAVDREQGTSIAAANYRNAVTVLDKAIEGEKQAALMSSICRE